MLCKLNYTNKRTINSNKPLKCTTNQKKMTRTNKWTEREGKADPKYFSHTGNYGESPNHIKKQGSGKGNWGKPGDEIDDLIDNGEIPPVFKKDRRGSNLQSHEQKFENVQKE